VAQAPPVNEIRDSFSCSEARSTPHGQNDDAYHDEGHPANARWSDVLSQEDGSENYRRCRVCRRNGHDLACFTESERNIEEDERNYGERCRRDSPSRARPPVEVRLADDDQYANRKGVRDERPR
jgi:hypothetical protein